MLENTYGNSRAAVNLVKILNTYNNDKLNGLVASKINSVTTLVKELASAYNCRIVSPKFTIFVCEKLITAAHEKGQSLMKDWSSDDQPQPRFNTPGLPDIAVATHAINVMVTPIRKLLRQIKHDTIEHNSIEAKKKRNRR